MEPERDRIIEQIIKHPLFLRLKNVVEISPYHDHEDVYSHSLKTKDIAIKEIRGDFITNPQAKQLFEQYTNEDINGMKRKDMMVLIALLHDIGKVLSVKEAGETRSILETRSDGNTSCPGHEYRGSLIVGTILSELNISPELISSIAQVIALHDTFNDGYMVQKSSWSMEQLISEVKSRAEDTYIEALFNIYCDNFTVDVSKSSREIIRKLFNEPSLYTRREYIIK
jgi:hypothetical protein